MNLSTLIEQKINEAVYDSASGGPQPLKYSIGFKAASKFKGPESYLNLDGLNPADKAILADKYNVLIGPKQKYGFAAVDKKTSIFYPITNEKEFFNGGPFKKMYDYLSSTGRYIMPSADLMKAEIGQAKMDSFTPEAFTAQDNKFKDLFEKIVRSLNDPRTKELLKKISSIGFDINKAVYGNVISQGNVIRAYAVKPDSTFLATRRQFRERFNRMLKSNARQIILCVPKMEGSSDEQAESQLGVKFNDIKSNEHKKGSFNVHATTDLSGFNLKVYFDISDTILIPGYPDTFTGQAGLVDNLEGVLNQFAIEELGDSKAQTDDLNITVDSGKNNEFFNRFIKYLSAHQNILPPGELGRLSKMDPNADVTVVSILKTYFSEVAFGREHDKNLKTSKVYASMAMILTIEELAETEKIKILRMHEANIDKYLKDRKDFVSISLPVTNVLRILEPMKESIMNESRIVTPEDVMAFFHINPASLRDGGQGQEQMQPQTEVKANVEENCNKEIEQIKENFFNTLNKLYKVK